MMCLLIAFTRKGDIALKGEMRIAYTILVKKIRGRGHLGHVGVEGRIILRLTVSKYV
jgi:hypothetical protein